MDMEIVEIWMRACEVASRKGVGRVAREEE
jgi:hypothetical protein